MFPLSTYLSLSRLPNTSAQQVLCFNLLTEKKNKILFWKTKRDTVSKFCIFNYLKNYYSKVKFKETTKCKKKKNFFF